MPTVFCQALAELVFIRVDSGLPLISEFELFGGANCRILTRDPITQAPSTLLTRHVYCLRSYSCRFAWRHPFSKSRTRPGPGAGCEHIPRPISLYDNPIIQRSAKTVSPRIEKETHSRT